MPDTTEVKPEFDPIHRPAHYASLTPEPIDVIVGWEMGFLAGSVMKYLARYRHKGRPVEDLKKAAKYLQWLIEEEEAKL